MMSQRNPLYNQQAATNSYANKFHEMKHPIWGFLMSNNRVSEVVTLIMNTFAKKFAHDVYCLCCHWPGPATRTY